MELQTKIPLTKESHNLIDYRSNILLLGSCFAEHIGEKLNYFKFQNRINPFGILFHPIAIEQFITKAINEDLINEENVFLQNERWHYFDAHSRLSSNTKDELLSNLNSSISVSHQSISKASHIVITLGTAWVYRHIASDAIVANCHKVPQKKFLKELLSIDEITNSLEAIVSLIRAINDKIAFIFTVSPVRHLKDGVVENNRSKAHLLAAVHQVANPRKQIHYFPAYEIVMDELRDYRFYSEDMIHLNQIAINYIWERFNEVWLSQDSNEIMKFVDDIQKGNKHKPFNKSSESHQLFLKKLKEKEEFVQILMAKQKLSKK